MEVGEIVYLHKLEKVPVIKKAIIHSKYASG